MCRTNEQTRPVHAIHIDGALQALDSNCNHHFSLLNISSLFFAGFILCNSHRIIIVAQPTAKMLLLAG